MFATKITNTSIGGEFAPETGPNDGLDSDEIFEILANRRRRYILHLLLKEGQSDLGEMADQIAAWENGSTIAEVDSTERKYVYTALQQTHLPKMHDVGVIRYDKDRGTIETTESIEEFDIYLEVVDEREIPWTEYYLGLGVCGLAIAVTAWAGVYPLSLFPDIAWTVSIATALTFSAAVHLYYAKQMRLGATEEPPELAYDRE